MSTATVRIPTEKRDVLKVIASLEKRDIQSILSDLIDEYIERHKETLELLSNPDWAESIQRGKEQLKKGQGKFLDELPD